MLASASWVIRFLAIVIGVISRHANTQGLNFNLYVCSSPGNCQAEPTLLVADYSYSCADQVDCTEVNLLSV